jgi:hypothetical protein
MVNPTGHMQSGESYRPYAIKYPYHSSHRRFDHNLFARIGLLPLDFQRLQEKLHVSVEHVGLSGFTAREMIEVLDKRQCTDRCGRVWPGINYVMNEAKIQGKPFSHVLILAGTNDLASERYGFRSAEDILKVRRGSSCYLRYLR